MSWNDGSCRFDLDLSNTAHAAAVACPDVADIRLLFLEAEHILLDQILLADAVVYEVPGECVSKGPSCRNCLKSFNHILHERTY